jgi:hypothetical protein
VTEIAKGCAVYLLLKNVLAMDGIDKVGLAYGGERFASNETTQRPASRFGTWSSD